MNPKATLFFLSVFTQVISPETIISTQIFYGIAMAITALLWFVFLSSVVNQKYIRKNIQK